jgi:hypothetical protein
MTAHHRLLFTATLLTTCLLSLPLSTNANAP